ncbi:hypothetical protein ABT247_21210 [Kitasatospora sp. NPDC001539]|uniref:hypothetical protein n=1 Tax=Kitasatospora sp. NPDC001539 TaxID=3154384 RepID=UPI003326A8E9
MAVPSPLRPTPIRPTPLHPTPPRSTPLRRRAVPVAAVAALALLVALAALALDRSAPGGLRDHGPLKPVTPPPVAEPLWPALAASPPPTTPAAGSATQAPPQPLPELTVPGRDLSAVDVRTVLAKDPGLSPEERRALDSCTECEVRTPEFRDLTGDGRRSLITTVTTPGPVVLHVYTLADDRVLPILRVEVQRGFSAATVGSDLWLYEPTTVSTRTSSHYQWDGVRLGLLERRVDGTGLLLPPGDADSGPPGAVVATPAPIEPGAKRPTAGPRPAGSGPAVASAAAQPPRAARPTPQPSAPASPAAPAATPEAKR